MGSFSFFFLSPCVRKSTRPNDEGRSLHGGDGAQVDHARVGRRNRDEDELMIFLFRPFFNACTRALTKAWHMHTLSCPSAQKWNDIAAARVFFSPYCFHSLTPPCTFTVRLRDGPLSPAPATICLSNGGGEEVLGWEKHRCRRICLAPRSRFTHRRRETHSFRPD